MAKKAFEERAASAVKDDRARLSDMECLIAEGEELIHQLEAKYAQAEIDAVDFQLNQLDRDLAVEQSAKTDRRIETVQGALSALEAKLAKRKDSDKQKAIEAEKKAALAERDELAKRFKTILQPMAEVLPELFVAVRENTSRLARAGLKDALDAELTARGLAGEFVNRSPIFRFTEMRIPAWADAVQVWPDGVAAKPGHAVYDETKVARQREQIIAKQRAKFGTYSLTPPSAGKGIQFVERKPRPMGSKIRKLHPEFGAQQCELDHAEAERLRGLGVKVERLPDAVQDESLIHW